MAHTITDANFQTEVMESDKVVMLDFWASWCGPCVALGPTVEAIATDYEGKAIVGKVNVDENPDVSVKFGIRNIPTILFIKNGEVVDKQVGNVPRSVLEQTLQKHM
jgi:thioredoxin 1